MIPGNIRARVGGLRRRRSGDQTESENPAKKDKPPSCSIRCSEWADWTMVGSPGAGDCPVFA